MARNLQYITDEAGNKTGVILSIAEYEELLEDLHVTRVAEETRNEERIPWEQVKAELTGASMLVARTESETKKSRGSQALPR